MPEPRAAGDLQGHAACLSAAVVGVVEHRSDVPAALDAESLVGVGVDALAAGGRGGVLVMPPPSGRCLPGQPTVSRRFSSGLEGEARLLIVIRLNPRLRALGAAREGGGRAENDNQRDQQAGGQKECE